MNIVDLRIKPGSVKSRIYIFRVCLKIQNKFPDCFSFISLKYKIKFHLKKKSNTCFQYCPILLKIILVIFSIQVFNNSLFHSLSIFVFRIIMGVLINAIKNITIMSYIPWVFNLRPLFNSDIFPRLIIFLAPVFCLLMTECDRKY